MTRTLDADYVVVGAGAVGLAFTDALVAYSDARVVVVDRREGPGGHWRQAYPFVRLHQASQFYGVASLPFGEGQMQTTGPEAGLSWRATGTEVCDYYDEVVRRLEATGRVDFLWRTVRESGRLRSLDSSDGRAFGEHCRVVDARYVSPTIPADTPPPFDVSTGVTAVPVGEIDSYAGAAQYVIVGSGKTATDAVVHLLGAGASPDSVTWLRPREPWMLNRARIQPDPTVYHEMVADTLEAAAGAANLAAFFAAAEEAGIMLRIDPRHEPTMARTPTLASWELDLLREVDDVVRLGHLRATEPGRLHLEEGDVSVRRDAVVVHCAVDGLRRPAMLPIWGAADITLQPVRGCPCFGAALVGYVEATRPADDDLKNDLVASAPFSSTREQWAEMTVRAARSAQRYLSEPDIAAWANAVRINPFRVPEGYASAMLEESRERIARESVQALDRLSQFAGLVD